MRFQLVDGVQFDIRFKYIPVYLFGAEVTYQTHCTISSVNQQISYGSDKYKPVAIGVAFQNPQDVFVKDKGRRIALARALEYPHFHKAFRKLAWNAYLNRK